MGYAKRINLLYIVYSLIKYFKRSILYFTNTTLNLPTLNSCLQELGESLQCYQEVVNAGTKQCSTINKRVHDKPLRISANHYTPNGLTNASLLLTLLLFCNLQILDKFNRPTDGGQVLER